MQDLAEQPQNAPQRPAVAIALQSESGRAQATQVVAKGSGDVAEQILQLAFDHGVKVRTDADLAAILSAVEVESEIPLEALTAVANILSYIYRAELPKTELPKTELPKSEQPKRGAESIETEQRS